MKFLWHIKSARIFFCVFLMILETCYHVIEEVNLSFNDNCIAINSKFFMKFMIQVLIFRRKWCICKISSAVNVRIYILNNDKLEITDHSVSKNIILQKLILQIAKFKISHKSYQNMKMKHFLIICFNNVIVICNLFKNINLFSIKLNKIIKKNFTNMIEKLSNSHWIWNCNCIINNCTDYKKAFSKHLILIRIKTRKFYKFDELIVNQIADITSHTVKFLICNYIINFWKKNFDICMSINIRFYWNLQIVKLSMIFSLKTVFAAFCSWSTVKKIISFLTEFQFWCLTSRVCSSDDWCSCKTL